MRDKTKGMIAWGIGSLIAMYVLLSMSGCVRPDPSWKMLHRSISAIQKDMNVTQHEAKALLSLLEKNHGESSICERMKEVVMDLGVANMWMGHVERNAKSMVIIERQRKKWGDPFLGVGEERRKVLDKTENP